MAVTELAFVHLSSPLSAESLQALEGAQRIQDKWAQDQDPNLPASRISRGTGMLQRTDDPSAILITARWRSPAAHWEWIDTDENKQAMGKLMPLIVSEGTRKLVVFHVDAVLFPPPENGVTPALGCPILSVYHYRFKSLARSKFESRLENVMAKFNTNASRMFRWGWRIEKDDDEVEELVIVRGWEDEERRLDGEPDPRNELSAEAIDVNVYSYKRIV